MMKEQKGITLIALVITIIVLLILAGVSIAMLTGDNGLLTKSTQAADDNAIGAVKDEISIAEQEGMTEYLEDHYSATVEKKDPVSIIREKIKVAIGYDDESTDPISNGSYRDCGILEEVVEDNVENITITKNERQCVGQLKITDGTDENAVKKIELKWSPIMGTDEEYDFENGTVSKKAE